MENALEGFYNAMGIFIFCMATGLLFLCFRGMDEQVTYIKTNIYEQHMLYGADIE